MKKNSHIVKNYMYNALYQIFAIASPLITTPYVSRVLGVTGIGTFGYTESIANYFILFGTLGSNLYGQREIAYVQDDPDKRTLVFKEIIAFRILTVFTMVIIYLVAFCRTGQYKSIFLILAIEIIASAFDISWFFQGIQDFKKVVMRNIIIKSLSIVLIFVLVKSENDVNLYTLCYALPVLISNLSLWLFLPSYLTKAKHEKIIIFKHVIPLLALFVPQIATQVYTVLDKTMIGVLASNIDQVGYFEQSQKMIKVLVCIITALGIVMLPQMSKLFVEGKVKEIHENIKRSFRFVFFLGFPLMFGIVGIAENFVPWFYGVGYDAVVSLMSIISPIIIIIGISNVIGKQYLLPTKKQKAYTVSVVVGAIINFILNLCLIPQFNAWGACIATVFAEFSVTAVQIWFVRNEIPLLSYLKIAIRYFIVGIIMFAGVRAMNYFVHPGFIGVLCQMVVGILLYLGVLFIIKDEMLFTGMSFVRNKLGKK